MTGNLHTQKIPWETVNKILAISNGFSSNIIQEQLIS